MVFADLVHAGCEPGEEGGELPSPSPDIQLIRKALLRNSLAQLIKEPLAQFLLIGAAIYAVYGFFGTPENSANERTITVTSGEIRALADTWTNLWNRPPTDEELSRIIRQNVREKILSREAVAMGLDKGDIVIRRRLAQRLEYLANSLITPEEPTAQEMEDWYAANTEKFKQPDLYWITHVFFDPDLRDVTALEDAESLRERLNALDTQPGNLSSLGDRFMLENRYAERTVTELSKLFGIGFVDEVIKLEPGQWFGPILSGYGVHVVKLDNHWQAPDPALTEVEELVRQDIMATKIEEMSTQFVDSLMSRYEIVVEETEVPITVPVSLNTP
jgi:hypothetical protein